MADAERLVELFEKASELSGKERAGFLDGVREEDASLATSLEKLLGQSTGRVPTDLGSFAKKLEDQYGSEADPHISLEGESEGTDFASELGQEVFVQGIDASVGFFDFFPEHCDVAFKRGTLHKLFQHTFC